MRVFGWLVALVCAAGCTTPAYTLVRRMELGRLTEGRIEEAHGIGLDRAGRLLVTDPALDHVYRYTLEGRFLDEIGPDPGGLHGPRDVKVDPQGRVYVVDGTSHRLLRFDPDGGVVASQAEAGTRAALNRPHALDLDASGRVYVADVDNGRVAVFDADCRFLREWPTPPVAPASRGAPHGIGVDPRGDIFVVDYNGACFKYAADGQLLASFAKTGATYHALCTDGQGFVYLAARGGRRKGSYIEQYTTDGVHVRSIEVRRPGTVHPVGLAADAAGRLYVTDDKGVDVLAPTASSTSSATDSTTRSGR